MSSKKDELRQLVRELQKVIHVLVQSICKHLIKPVADPFTIIDPEIDDETIIDSISSKKYLQDVIFISTDGTTINTQDYARIVGLNATANLIWGPELRQPTIVTDPSRFQLRLRVPARDKPGQLR